MTNHPVLTEWDLSHQITLLENTLQPCPLCQRQPFATIQFQVTAVIACGCGLNITTARHTLAEAAERWNNLQIKEQTNHIQIPNLPPTIKQTKPKKEKIK